MDAERKKFTMAAVKIGTLRPPGRHAFIELEIQGHYVELEPLALEVLMRRFAESMKELIELDAVAGLTTPGRC